ncbi:gamma-glutamylcyclotransferase family protein [Thermosynechococcus sp. HN-54]|uniref:gamma-glutamylcyclotransferase family protein n=1 Tax=Thermosynechococcus sp. HN-54 TaxID=2933959 RepID=UPI0037DC5E42
MSTIRHFLRYFAYGSNLCTAPKKRRLGRVPEAAIAQLCSYRLVFNKRSEDGTGKANLVPHPNHSVWGGIYSCTAAEIERLDYYDEGADTTAMHLSKSSRPQGRP